MNYNKKRVAITGLGVVSSIGNDIDSFYESLKSGKSGASYLERFKSDEVFSKVAFEIKV